jgi:hypothetical protein
METVPAHIYESHSSERGEKLEIKCIWTDPSVNTPSWVEHESLITREISGESFMRVIDLFNLPVYCCIETVSPTRIWSDDEVVRRHKGAFTIMIGASAPMAVNIIDSEAFKQSHL